MAMTKEERNAKRRQAYAAKKAEKLEAVKATAEDPMVKTPWDQMSDEDQQFFLMRVDNEKKNIWRTTAGDPEAILKFCAENKRDERRSAIRRARQDAIAWAIKQKPCPF